MSVAMTDIPSGFTRLESTSPFHELVGPFYERRDRATLIIGMPVAKKHINRRGAVHGGMICTLVDFAMGQAASTMTNPPRKVVTTSLSTDFAGNATDGDWIEAHVDVLRSGRRIVFVNCFVYHRSERIARGSAAFLVLTPDE
jgi:acyl-coenzyme A thioesterase 13